MNIDVSNIARPETNPLVTGRVWYQRTRTAKAIALNCLRIKWWKTGTNAERVPILRSWKSLKMALDIANIPEARKFRNQFWNNRSIEPIENMRNIWIKNLQTILLQWVHYCRNQEILSASKVSRNPPDFAQHPSKETFLWHLNISLNSISDLTVFTVKRLSSVKFGPVCRSDAV